MTVYRLVLFAHMLGVLGLFVAWACGGRLSFGCGERVRSRRSASGVASSALWGGSDRHRAR